MTSMRESAILEADMVASKRRFGLFSQPPTLAIGDDSLFRQKSARKGEDGKPITLPRNMLAGPNRSGVGSHSFIQPPESIHVGDLYLDPEKVDGKYNKQFHTRAKFHQREFIPSTGRQTLASSSYKYKEQNPLQKLKPARDDTGRVITKPRNFLTNPMTNVSKSTFKFPPYIPDPYERKDMIAAQERMLTNSKMPPAPDRFRSMSHGNIIFAGNQETFGFDDKAKEIMKSKSPFIESPPTIVGHEGNFKPARRGHGDAIGKYPQFIIPQSFSKGDIIKAERKPKSQKESWKPSGTRGTSRPTPSISYSASSLRKYF